MRGSGTAAAGPQGGAGRGGGKEGGEGGGRPGGWNGCPRNFTTRNFGQKLQEWRFLHGILAEREHRIRSPQKGA